MSEAQSLMNKLAALRMQLEQARGPAAPARVSRERVEQLSRQVQAGFRYHAILDGTLKELGDPSAQAVEHWYPRPLTARARRLLRKGQELLGHLRKVADQLNSAEVFDRSLAEPLSGDAEDPLAQLFHETMAMTNAVLRMVQAFPESGAAQVRLCEGLEGMLTHIAERVAALLSALDRRRRRQQRIATLADRLLCLHASTVMDVKPFLGLCESILDEVEEGEPIRWHEANAPRANTEWVAHHIACHALNVAQVLARIVRNDPELHGRALEFVLAALLFDVGMLDVPSAIVARPETLDQEQRRAVELHPRMGARLVARLLPEAAWMIELTHQHHERIDGTGYPAGLRDEQVLTLTRILSACDVYCAFAEKRPHRPARDPRTALAETLLMAHQGILDTLQVERLLGLTYFPVGSVVELNNGAVGLVVANHMHRPNQDTPTRPVLMMLSDPDGKLLATPRPIDLADAENHMIARVLSAEERGRLLGRRHPEWA